MKKLISVVLALAMVLSLSAGVIAYEAPAGVNSLAIVGASIPGVSDWTPSDPNGDLELVADNVYEKVIEVTAATTMTVKFAGNDKWDDSCNLGGSYKGDPITIGELKNLTNGSGAQDMTLVVDEACTLKFTVDMTAGVNAATVLVEKVVEIPEPDTYYLANGVTQSITIPAGGAANVVVDARGSDMILNVNGYRMFMDWWFQAGMFPTYPNMGGFAEAQIPMGDIYTITINNSNTEMDQIVDVTATPDAPSFGTWDNPAELVIGDNVAEVGAGGNAYFYNWTATEDGELTISVITAVSFDWALTVNVYGESSSKYGDTHYSDEETIVSSETVQVTAGDLVEVIVGSASFADATVVLEASFVAGEVGGEGGEGGEGEGGGDIGGDTVGEVVESGTDVLIQSGYVPNRDTNYETLYIPFTPDVDGTLTIHMISGNPGWMYKFYFADGSSTTGTRGTGEEFESFDVLAGNTYAVELSGYFDWEDVDATVSYELIFTPGEVDQEQVKEEYVISDVVVGLGENTLTLDPNAITTIYEFCPDEGGVYKFTVNNAMACVGYWGAGSFFVTAPTGDLINSMEYELPNAGPSIMVGISDVEGEFTLTIEKVSDVEEQEQIEYEEYVVQHVPQEENMVDVSDVQINNVDITKPQTIVKDENGFYHLGSVDGPIIYVNLMNEGFDIVQAFFGGYGALAMRGEYTDAEGNATKYEFKDAMFHYANVLNNSEINNDENFENDNGLYPLTDDLMIFLKAFGAAQGWYMAGLSPYEAINAEHDADSAWMVCCVYLGEEISEEPEVNPGAGDYSIAGLVVAMMAATAGVVVIGKKKEF